VANYIGRHVPAYGGYQPRHAASGSLGRGFTGRLVSAVAVLVFGLVIGGSGIAMRVGPQRPVAVDADYVAPAEAMLPGQTSPHVIAPEGSMAFGSDTVPASQPETAPAAVPHARAGTCIASWYGGTQTPSDAALSSTAPAFRTLAVGSRVRVMNVANGLSTVVHITGRGQSVAGRCLNLSLGGFDAIADPGSGVISVRYEVLS
jgi:rare lipoprotein A